MEAAHGLKIITEITNNTATPIITIAKNRYKVRCKYCSQKVNGIPVGKTDNPNNVYCSQIKRISLKKYLKQIKNKI